jgi:hypothetical protein
MGHTADFVVADRDSQRFAARLVLERRRHYITWPRRNERTRTDPQDFGRSRPQLKQVQLNTYFRVQSLLDLLLRPQ